MVPAPRKFPGPPQSDAADAAEPQGSTVQGAQRFRTSEAGLQGQAVADELVVEEPLEIRINGRRYSSTMRTPGADRWLALGLLLSEGAIDGYDDVEKVDLSTRCRELDTELINVVNVVLHEAPRIAPHLWERSLISNSSCGLCGMASVEALTKSARPLQPGPGPHPTVILGLPDRLRERQPLFDRTGGLHAAGIFDMEGDLMCAFEDIARHNATDKAIGWALENGRLQTGAPLVLLVSGRVSFEIVQKALMAGIGNVAAVSAASSLAVQLAEANNLNLIGFLRPAGFTLYCGQLQT